MIRPLSSLLIAVVLATLAAPASAACYADYKAKRDTPLRLHYGVAQIDVESAKDSDAERCDMPTARTLLEPRLAEDDWTLLNILSVFDDAGLEEREESAGPYFLRY